MNNGDNLISLHPPLFFLNGGQEQNVLVEGPLRVDMGEQETGSLDILELQKRPPAKDGAVADRDLVTRLDFRFVVGICIPKIKNQTHLHYHSLYLFIVNICFREMLEHLHHLQRS